jgi:asparaginyl-tRNA synthetase
VNTPDQWQENNAQRLSAALAELRVRLERAVLCGRDTAKLENVKAPFPRLHYDDAIKLIQSRGSETQWGSDFGGTDETVIAEAHDRPVVVHRFPSAIKAFYMEPDPERPEYSLSADILAPEGYGEIVGGGERMSSAESLLAAIHAHQLPEEAFRWYLDLRKYGSVPHAGFGMGIERLVTWICGIEHLRETIPFPRLLNRLRP